AKRSALRELEAFARLGAAVLLALDHTRVARDEAGRAEGRLQGGVERDEGAGDAEADGLDLTRDAAARGVDDHVELARRVRHRERGGQHLAAPFERDVRLGRLLVDRDGAVAGAEVDPRRGRLAAPYRR